MAKPLPEIVWEIRLRLLEGDSTASLVESWRLLESMPPYDPARLEVEASLHMFLARLCWRDADQARARQARQARRMARR
jgi:hypothetical protein